MSAVPVVCCTLGAQAAGLMGPAPSTEPSRAPARGKGGGKMAAVNLTNSMQQEQLRTSIDALDSRLVALTQRMKGARRTMGMHGRRGRTQG